MSTWLILGGPVRQVPTVVRRLATIPSPPVGVGVACPSLTAETMPSPRFVPASNRELAITQQSTVPKSPGAARVRFDATADQGRSD